MRRSIFVFAMMALAACGHGAEGPANTTAMTPVVEAQPAAVQSLDHTIDALGSVRAIDRVSVSPEIDGKIEEVLFKDGDTVTLDTDGVGPVLFRLDDDILSLQVESAKADLARARASLDEASADYDRKKALIRSKATTEEQFTRSKTGYERAQAELQAAQAALDLAQQRLERTTIRAPFTGVLGQRMVSPGDYVKAGAQLVELVMRDPVDVQFSVPERYSAELEPGLAVKLSSKAYPGREFSGQVVFVSPTVDPQTRAIDVKARVANPDGTLSPGLFLDVELVVGQRDDAVVVPEQAIVPRGGKFYVYVVSDGTAHRKEVSLGQRLPGAVEITSGLAGKETVVTAGFQRISDGSAVTIRK